MTKSFYHLHTFNLHCRPLVHPKNCNTSSLAPTESSKRSPLSHTNSIFLKPSRYIQSFMSLFSTHTDLQTLSTITLHLFLLLTLSPSTMPMNLKLTGSST